MTRKLRVEWNERLVDMANQLGVTGGYLSAVERGLRNAPIEWIDVLTTKYELSEEESACFTNALSESRLFNKLDVSHLSFDDKQMIKLLVEKLPSLNQGFKEELTQLMSR